MNCLYNTPGYGLASALTHLGSPAPHGASKPRTPADCRLRHFSRDGEKQQKGYFHCAFSVFSYTSSFLLHILHRTYTRQGTGIVNLGDTGRFTMGSQSDFNMPAHRETFAGFLFDMDGTIIDSTTAIVKHWHTHVPASHVLGRHPPLTS